MQFSKIAIRGCALGLVAASMLLAGCSSVPLDESAKAGTTQDDAAAKHRSASGAALDSNAVYFDFDSYTVKPEFMPVVETHARNLMANPSRHVTVEGNTDNRGSREYNLALGQKRSDNRGSREYNLALGQKRSEAVKQRLQLLGVPASRIEAVSFGREKPRALGDTEEAWAQNRRADIVYR